MNTRPRLTPELDFPPYTFVPGQSPHPISDPRGHRYGLPAGAPEALDPDAWRNCRGYLYGIDLFNAGFYWEAHEQWEALWLSAGRHGALADFLKALIKLAAAGVKRLEGRPGGVVSHAQRAADLLRPLAAGQSQLAGLRLAELLALAETIAQGAWPTGGPALTVSSRDPQPE